jgi:nuclear transport factor 2 (NTF2) superfamily protein
MTALVPPFTRGTAIAKVRMAEDGWNSRDPHRVSLAYTEDGRTGTTAAAIAFLARHAQARS